MRYSQVGLVLVGLVVPPVLAQTAPSQAGQASSATLSITHGVAVGDVTAISAIVWARSSAAATMTVEVAPDATFSSPRRFQAKSILQRDLAAQVTLTDLSPGTTYHYRVSFSSSSSGPSSRSKTETGTFSTAPQANQTAPVHFVVAGDLGGQAYCRHEGRGYDIFAAMGALEPDFFVANGDMIYADGACPAQGQGDWINIPGDFPSIDHPQVDWTNQAQVRGIYLRHWRYNRADPHHQAFLRQVPIYTQWDDHEVINDFGAPWESWSKDLERRGYPNLVRAGHDALFAWNPITHHPDEPGRIYRSFRWGQDVELFLLDARSYRSLNDLSVRPERTKTLLGKAQLQWLIDGLRGSDATWKIVSTDVPLSIPTGSEAELYGRDAFANGDHPWQRPNFATRTGFEDELRQILQTLDEGDIGNVVFVVTDVHFAMNLRYDVDVDGDGDKLLFHEFVSGPLNAVRLPIPPQLDPTFKPTILYAEADIFNFSYIKIMRRGAESVLVAEVRDETGAVRFGSRVELVAE